MLRARRCRFFSSPFLCITVLALAIARSAGAQNLPQHYEIMEVRVPGSTQTLAVDINDQQQAVFTWLTSVLYTHSGIFDANTGTLSVADLGTLPGGSLTEARGINNAGEVVGYAYASPGYTGHAFVYRNGVLSSLGMLPGAEQSAAFDITDSGIAVGWSQQPTETNAVQFSGSGPSRLTTIESQAHSVNNFGVAAGYAMGTDGLFHAAIFRNGSVIDLGFMNTNTLATDINDSEDVTLYTLSWGPRRQRSFLVTSWGSRTDLGTLPGYESTQANAINNYGMIVGGVGNDIFDFDRAFVYGDCRIEDLTDMIDPASPLKPYVTLMEAKGINNNGWIIATGYDSRDPWGYSYWRAYVLKPVGPPENICT
jgi:probable HAF family extracellular repeat protein